MKPQKRSKRAELELNMRSTTYFAAVNAVIVSEGRARPSAAASLPK
jgi:hypothetical protein